MDLVGESRGAPSEGKFLVWKGPPPSVRCSERFSQSDCLFLGFTSPKNIDRIFFKNLFSRAAPAHRNCAQELNLAALELSRLFQTKCEIECDKELPNALNYYEFVVLLTQVKAGSRLKSFRGFLGRCLSIEMFQGC